MDSPGVSRRSVVRAGATTAWAVPVISLATAAPALAVSGGGELQASVTFARYVLFDNSEDARPDRLEVEVAVQNLGTGPTGDVVLDLVIPGGLHSVAPTVDETANLTSSLVTGSFAGGWVVHLVSATPLSGGGSQTYLFRVQLNDPVDASPYRAWAGSGFPFTLTASSTGFTPAVVDDQAVAASANTYFSFDAMVGDRVGDQLTLSWDVTNRGRRTTQNLQLEISWAGNGGGPGDYFDNPPASAAAALGGWYGGARTGDGSPGSPWTYTFFRDEAVACTGSGASIGSCSAPFTTTIPLGSGTDEGTGGVYVRVKVTADAADPKDTELGIDVVVDA